MKSQVKNWLKSYLHVFLETLPFVGLIFVLNPILIALAPSEPFDHKLAFVILGAVGLLVSMFVALVISFASDKYRHIIITLFRSLFLLFFSISIFYSQGGSRIDGSTTITPSLAYYFLFYGSCTIAVVVLFVLFEKFKNVLRNLYVTFALFGVILAIYYPLLRWEQPSPHVHNYSVNTNLDFASDRNIIVILADMMQGSTLEQYFRIYPTEKDNFQGLTLFSRATSPFPFTTYAAPAILTGNVYNKGSIKTAEEAQKEAWTSSFLTDAMNSGFAPTTIGLDCVKLHPDQFSYQSSNPFGAALTLFALSIQKMTQSPRALGFNSERWLVGYKIKSTEIMDRLAEAPIGKSKNKIFFFHSMIPHAPCVFKRKDLEFMPLLLDPLDLNVENYWEETAFFLGQLSRVFEHMKRLGIYDKSLIIITGDHGHFIGGQGKLYEYPGSEDFEGDSRGAWARFVSMYNPGILIKPPLTEGALQISRAASSTLGIRPLVQRYIANQTELLKDFELTGQNKVIVFKEGITSDPYQSPDEHILLEFSGNASALAHIFKNSQWVERDLLYKIGNKITNFKNHLNCKWLLETGGAWLQGRSADLSILLPDIEDKAYKLQVSFSPLVNKRHPIQRIRISLNNTVLGLFSFKEKQILDIVIPKGLFVKDKINKFTFEPLDAISPKEIGAWESSSELSVFLQSFQLLPH
jgi:hypothetical protein